MCCNNPRTSQGGALAVLSLLHDSSGSPIRSSVPIMAGRLLFQDKSPEEPGSAQMVSLVPDQDLDLVALGGGCMIGIHETGDLTTSAIISPFKYRFGLQRSLGHDVNSQFKMQTKLSSPLPLGIGGEGIIGRRVTLWKRDSTAPFAEGIIGYN